MLIRILILLIALLIIPDVYIYAMYARKWKRSWWIRTLTFLPTILLLAYMMLVLSHDDMTLDNQVRVGQFMIVFLLVTVPRFLFTLFDCIGWMIRKGRRYTRIFAMTIAFFSAIILAYGYFIGRSRFVVHQQTFWFENLPTAFDGYRIVQFSDLHLGTFYDGHQQDVTTLVNLINQQKGDAIVFTGDLVNYESRESDGYKNVLRRLHAPDGVFSIMGNHDYSMYRPIEEAIRKADIAELQRREREDYGWTLLLNEHVVIRRNKDSIAVIGVENDGRPPFPSLGDLPLATKGLSPSTFSILLSHDPTHWRRNVLPDTQIDLTLSGHTHAGQFKVFGWSPVSHVYDEWSGAYVDGKQILNVSDGVGQVMFPFRFGAWPEINVITLKKKQK